MNEIRTVFQSVKPLCRLTHEYSYSLTHSFTLIRNHSLTVHTTVTQLSRVVALVPCEAVFENSQEPGLGYLVWVDPLQYTP